MNNYEIFEAVEGKMNLEFVGKSKRRNMDINVGII